MEKNLDEAFGYGSDYDDDVGSDDKMDVDETPLQQEEEPLTEIIFITTHGGLITRQKKGLSEPLLVPIPNNMEVIKISVTAPGIINISNNIDIIMYYRSIIEVFQQLSDPHTSISELNQILNELIKKFQIQFEQKVRMKKTDISGLTDDDDNYIRDFKRHSNKAFQVYYLNSGKLIADKEYSRTDSDDKTVFDFRILNVADGMDLLSKDNDQITTKEIIDYFSQNGTKRLIIFDFSCSTCLSTNERDIRGLRRSIITRHAYGGSRRNRNKQKTKNRNKNKQITKKRRAYRKK